MVLRERHVPWPSWLSITSFIEKGASKPIYLDPNKDSLVNCIF